MNIPTNTLLIIKVYFILIEIYLDPHGYGPRSGPLVAYFRYISENPEDYRENDNAGIGTVQSERAWQGVAIA